MSTSTLFRTLTFTAVMGCALAAHAQKSDRIPQGVQEFLLTSAASDFAAHGQQPDKVRNVHMRFSEQDTGERIYLLCGEFLPASTVGAGWTHFATIKTAHYEQWIGGMAETHCAHALPLSAGGDDLSSALQARLSAGAASAERP